MSTVVNKVYVGNDPVLRKLSYEERTRLKTQWDGSPGLRREYLYDFTRYLTAMSKNS